jgi:prepilin-type processing-associated H-X9-DG protein
MLVEEPAAYGERPPPGSAVLIDDGRWQPKVGNTAGNSLSLRHSQRGGNGNFADGHSELIRWPLATNQASIDPAY